MADRAPPADPSRGGRGQSIHTGANDVGLLAPTPMVFGLAGGIALPAAASASEAGATTPSAPTDGPSALTSSFGPDVPATSEPLGLVAVAPSSDPGTTSSYIATAQSLAAELVPLGLASALPIAMQVATHAPSMLTSPPPQADVSEAVSAVRASADALTGALQNLVSQLDGPAPAGIDQVTGAIDALGQTVESSLGAITYGATTLLEDVQTTATDLVNGAVGVLGNTVDTTLEVATEQVGALLDGTGQLATDVLDGATTALDTTISTVAEVAQETVSAVTPLVESTIDTAASIAAPLVETVAETTAPVTEAVTDLIGIGGPDPAGGITTLTGMLADADGFAVVAPDAPDLAAPVFASVGDLPDTLESVGDIVTTTIDHDDGGGLLGSVIDSGSSLLGGDDKHGLGGLFDGDHGHG